MKRLSLLSLTIVLLIASAKSYGQSGTVYSPSLDLYVNQDTGGLWHSRSASQMDSMISNQLNRNMEERMQLGQMEYTFAATERIGKKLDGQRKIGRGEATTKFTSMPQNSLVERMAAKAATPQEQQEIRESFNIALTTFNNILKAKRLSSTDTADVSALAFVLSYIVYHGEDPGDARLMKMRNFMRDKWLKDAVQQGTPDVEKQRTAESRVFRTMLAVRAAQAGNRANLTVQVKQTTQTTAREYATGVLKELWPAVPPEQMALSNTTAWGFADRGTAIIESGKATTTFIRNNDILSGSELAKKYNISERKIEQLMSEFDLEVKRRGGAINDVAWVNAISFALVYGVYTDGKVKLNQPQFNWILKEMRKDMLAMKPYQSSSNEEKQKYYEEVALDSMIIYDNYQTMYEQSLKDKAKERLNNIFNPRKLEDYELQPNGFVKVR